MKQNFIKRAVGAVAVAILVIGGSLPASGQYYEIANQLQGVLSPALSGAGSYKGFVELSGVAGFGDNRANIISLTTSQGFQYNSWFFMGAGLGLDVAMTSCENPQSGSDMPDYWGHSNASTKLMVPLFSDFRFTFGNSGGISFFADIKAGAIWLMGNSYLRLQHGCLTGDAQFYLKPAIGVRIPVSDNQRQAVNIGVAYQLITSNNNYSYWNNRSVTLNGVGASVSFEW